MLLLCREGTDKDDMPLKAKIYEINAHVRDIFVTQLCPQLAATCSSCRFSRLFREITKRGNACPFQTIMYYRDAFKFNSAEEISLHTLMIFFKTTVACRPQCTGYGIIGSWQIQMATWHSFWRSHDWWLNRGQVPWNAQLFQIACYCCDVMFSSRTIWYHAVRV